MNTSNPSEEQSIRIEAIRVKGLAAFAESFFAHSNGQVIAPISKTRALAHSLNPCADDNDIGLFVAYDGNKCVGYRGILPGWLKISDQLSKVSWASSIYVLPEYRKHQVGRLLMEQWIGLGMDLAATGSTTAAGNLYKRSQFQAAGPLPYLAIKLEEANLAAYPFKLLHRVAGLQRMADAGARLTHKFAFPMFRKAYYYLVACRSRRMLSSIRHQEVSEVRPVPAAAASPAPHFHRGIETINWMLRYKWFREGGEPCHPPYYFSDVRERFQYFALELQDRSTGDYGGFAVFSLSKTTDRFVLKVLDWQLTTSIPSETVFWLACRYAAQYQVDRIEMPAEFSTWAEQLALARRTVTTTDRLYYFHPARPDSPLARAIPKLQLNFCDSDLAFF